jgi:sugar lactone lactonase YvrE
MYRLFVFLLLTAPAFAGYEAPCYIDGGQSADGRYIMTAELVERGPTPHGPNRWKFHWHDTQTNTKRSFPAEGVQAGQIYAHLFVPPGGETFALWNHVTMWSDGKSNSHASAKLNPKDDSDTWRKQSAFSKRLILYSSANGSIVKEFAVADFLQPEEWQRVLPVFNRVHWIADYQPLSYRNTPRSGYAFYRISPDYSILEFRVVAARGAKDKSGRPVHVRLTDGHILAANEYPTEQEKVPVRPFVGPDKLPSNDGKVREAYVPHLDPVRVAGELIVLDGAAADSNQAAANQNRTNSTIDQANATTAIPSYQPARLIQDGFRKADTPSWNAAQQHLLFADLEIGKLFQWKEGEKATEFSTGGRGKFGPEGRWYGIHSESLVAWKLPDEQPVQLLAKPSLNDIAISAKYAYFTTLKDPEKGRLSIVDISDGTSRVAFDGEKDQTLVNPNGVCLSPDGKFLYVGISSYKDKKQTGLYRFPIAADGSLDVETGKQTKWYNASSPDGIAVDAQGNVFVTVGGQVAIINSKAKKIGELKIPQGSGTNLCFGGGEGKTLFVTTEKAIYAFEPK